MAAKNSRKFEFKMGKTGLFVLILFLSVLVFFSFIFGVTVGKHIDVYPEKLSASVPAFVKEKLGLTSQPPEQFIIETKMKDINVLSPAQERVDLTFYDTLSQKDGAKEPSVANSKPGDSSLDKTAKKNETQARKTDARKSGSLPVKSDGVTAAVAAPVTTKKKVEPRQEEKEEKGKYAVHVVSFRERQKTDMVIRQLNAMGFNAKIVEVDVPRKGKWFRVIVPGYLNKEEAQKASQRIGKSVSGVNCAIMAK